MTVVNTPPKAAPATKQDSKPLEDALRKVADAQAKATQPSPEEIAKAAQAAKPPIAPPKPPTSGSVVKDKPAATYKPQPEAGVQLGHNAQSFKLTNQRFNFLVECPLCHWQARCMTEQEVEHYIAQHAAHKAATKPF